VLVMTATRYSTQFFQEYELGSRSSARRILPIVLELLDAHSLIDVGCGVGAWARTAMDLGVPDVIGVDGHYIDPHTLHIPRDNFLERDLNYPLELDRRFDLAVSMEVAEHLPRDRGKPFVGELTKLAPAVLFSAAIPWQDGNYHVNERWPSYWAKLFLEHGFYAFDVVRGQVWCDKQVEPWYAQNTVLYLARDAAAGTTLTPAAPEGLFDVVHPEIFAARMALPRLRYLLRALPEAVGRRLRHR
jgi:Methyltransferase domain